MKKHFLYEDKPLAKLPVILSEDLSLKIESVLKHNQGNIEVREWYETIESVKNQLSNPVIAWDNTGSHIYSEDGEVTCNIFGYNVVYMIKTNATTHKNYVFIININLKTEDFGLNENAYRKLQFIIKECVRSAFKERLNKQLI